MTPWLHGFMSNDKTDSWHYESMDSRHPDYLTSVFQPCYLVSSFPEVRIKNCYCLCLPDSVWGELLKNITILTHLILTSLSKWNAFITTTFMLFFSRQNNFSRAKIFRFCLFIQTDFSYTTLLALFLFIKCTVLQAYITQILSTYVWIS